MEQQGIIAVIAVAIGSLFTFFTQWIRRDKTESEAELDDAQSDKIKADAVTSLYQTIAQMSGDIHAQAKATIDYIHKLDSCTRDVWRLERANERANKQYAEDSNAQASKIATLESQVAELGQSKLLLESQVADLTQSKQSLEIQVAALVQSSTEKDNQIKQMRGRIQVLETERAQLNEQLAEKASGDNGKETVKSEPVADKPVEKTPEIDGQKISDGQ